MGEMDANGAGGQRADQLMADLCQNRTNKTSTDPRRVGCRWSHQWTCSGPFAHRTMASQDSRPTVVARKVVAFLVMIYWLLCTRLKAAHLRAPVAGVCSGAGAGTSLGSDSNSGFDYGYDCSSGLGSGRGSTGWRH